MPIGDEIKWLRKERGGLIRASLSEAHTSVYHWPISLYVHTSDRTHIPHMHICSKYTHVTPYHARVHIQVPRVHSRSYSNFDV